jgi:hypothetical protein
MTMVVSLFLLCVIPRVPFFSPSAAYFFFNIILFHSSGGALYTCQSLATFLKASFIHLME